MTSYLFVSDNFNLQRSVWNLTLLSSMLPAFFPSGSFLCICKEPPLNFSKSHLKKKAANGDNKNVPRKQTDPQLRITGLIGLRWFPHLYLLPASSLTPFMPLPCQIQSPGLLGVLWIHQTCSHLTSAPAVSSACNILFHVSGVSPPHLLQGYAQRSPSQWGFPYVKFESSIPSVCLACFISIQSIYNLII